MDLEQGCQDHSVDPSATDHTGYPRGNEQGWTVRFNHKQNSKWVKDQMEELKLSQENRKNLYDNGFGNDFLGQETISTAANNNKIDTLNIIKTSLKIIFKKFLRVERKLKEEEKLFKIICDND